MVLTARREATMKKAIKRVAATLGAAIMAVFLASLFLNIIGTSMPLLAWFLVM